MMNRSRLESTGANLQHFVDAQDNRRGGHGAASFATALCELTAGRKTSHWIWYVLPMMLPLPAKSPPSERAAFFAIRTPRMAIQYLSHNVLGPRYLQCVLVILAHLEFWNSDLERHTQGERANAALQDTTPRCVVTLMGSTVDTVKLYLSLSTFALASCVTRPQPVEPQKVLEGGGADFVRCNIDAPSATPSLSTLYRNGSSSSTGLLLAALVEVVRNLLFCGATPLLEAVVPVEMRSLQAIQNCKDLLVAQETGRERSGGSCEAEGSRSCLTPNDGDVGEREAKHAMNDSRQPAEVATPPEVSVAGQAEKKGGRESPQVDPSAGQVSRLLEIARRLCHPGVRTAWELHSTESDTVSTR